MSPVRLLLGAAFGAFGAIGIGVRATLHAAGALGRGTVTATGGRFAAGKQQSGDTNDNREASNEFHFYFSFFVDPDVEEQRALRPSELGAW